MEPLIPKIKEEICFSIEKEIASDDYLSKMAKHLAEHNPTVGGFLYLFVTRLPPCCSKAAMLAALTTYRLIESQMEADRMNRELKT